MRIGNRPISCGIGARGSTYETTLRRAPRANRKKNNLPERAFEVHLSDAGFPGFLSRSGCVGSNWKPLGYAFVLGFRALSASILRWTSSSAEDFRAEGAMGVTGVEEGSPLHFRHCIQVEQWGDYMPALCGECVRVDLVVPVAVERLAGCCKKCAYIWSANFPLMGVGPIT